MEVFGKIGREVKLPVPFDQMKDEPMSVNGLFSLALAS